MIGKYRGDRPMAHRPASERVTNAEERVLARPERGAAEPRSSTRTEHHDNLWGIWPKAIANPAATRAEARDGAQTNPTQRRRQPCPRHGSVLDAVRLRHTGLVRRRKAPISLEDRAATRSFSCQGGPLFRYGTEGIKLRPPGTAGGSDGLR
jgi:hypothetical protein